MENKRASSNVMIKKHRDVVEVYYILEDVIPKCGLA